jgi:hypothetical protein
MTNVHIPKNVRHTLLEQIEDIGQVAGLLRQSIDDCECGNEEAGRMCASDALEILSQLEGRFSRMTASLAAFSENVKGEARADTATPPKPPTQ